MKCDIMSYFLGKCRYKFNNCEHHYDEQYVIYEEKNQYNSHLHNIFENMSHSIQVTGMFSAGLDNIWINIMNCEIKAIHNRCIKVYIF